MREMWLGGELLQDLRRGPNTMQVSGELT